MQSLIIRCRVLYIIVLCRAVGLFTQASLQVPVQCVVLGHCDGCSVTGLQEVVSSIMIFWDPLVSVIHHIARYYRPVLHCSFILSCFFTVEY